jgi:ABC-type polysaccharide/polyol phosphate export permease
MVKAQRAHLISVALIVFIGIWLTGFDKVHWFLYIPVIALTFAGITGICPGLIFWNKVGLK